MSVNLKQSIEKAASAGTPSGTQHNNSSINYNISKTRNQEVMRPLTNVGEENRALTFELIYELEKMSIQQIRATQKEWNADLERINASELVRKYCNAVCDVVIEKKLEKAAVK